MKDFNEACYSEINTKKKKRIYIVGAWARNKKVNRQIKHQHAFLQAPK